MKRFFKIAFLTLVMAICAISAVACSAPAGGENASGLLYKKFKGDDFYTVYGYVQEEGVTEIDIGDYNKDGVVIGAIKAGAFKNNNTLKSVIVPDTVTEIGAGAFAGMQKLEEITLPFVGTSAVSDPSYNDQSSTEKATDVKRTFCYVFGTEAFNYGISVTQKYNSGEGTATYYLPMNLKTVNIMPKEDYAIPMFAFAQNNLVENVVLTEKVVGIGDSAFLGCTALKSVTGVVNVEIIYENAFNGCSNYNVNLAEYTALTEIKDGAFESSGIKTVNLVTGVTYGDRVFKNSALTSVTVNCDKLTYAMFYGCKNLAEIKINVSSLLIKDYALDLQNDAKVCVIKIAGGETAFNGANVVKGSMYKGISDEKTSLSIEEI